MWQLVLYVNPFTVLLFVLGTVAFSLTFCRWSASRPDHGVKAARSLFRLCLAVVLVATLMPTEPIGSGVRNVWLTPGDGLVGPGVADLFPQERRMVLALTIANAAMFVPLGVLWYGIAKGAPALTAVTGCSLLSVGIEAVQFLMNAGRIVDIDDVLFNTAGAVIGALVAATAHALSRRNVRAHRAPRRAGAHRATS
ncbi:VanZ family protein [Streptomyces griseoviridis]